MLAADLYKLESSLWFMPPFIHNDAWSTHLGKSHCEAILRWLPKQHGTCLYSIVHLTMIAIGHGEKCRLHKVRCIWTLTLSVGCPRRANTSTPGGRRLPDINHTWESGVTKVSRCLLSNPAGTRLDPRRHSTQTGSAPGRTPLFPSVNRSVTVR